MFEIEKLLNSVEKVPVASWVKLNYKAPKLLAEVNEKICNLFINLTDDVEKLTYYKNVVKEKFEGDLESFTYSNVIGAGGYVSDFVNSKINAIPFKPKDIDFFIAGEFLESMLDHLVRPKSIEISKEEYKELKNQLEGLSNFMGEDGKYYKRSDWGNVWDIFGEKLKEIFPDCQWDNKNKFGYENSVIDVVYRFEYDGLPVEIIVGKEKRVLDFDIAFRCVYFSGGDIYINSMALEDIQKKRIRIIHSDTPISTLLRALDFEERYGFEIEQFSLMLFLNAVNFKNLERSFFLENFRGHKKHSLQLESKLFQFKMGSDHSLSYGNGANYIGEELMRFELDDFPDYKPELKDLYSCCHNALKDKGSLLYPKIEAFLKEYSEIKVTYKRPENWYDKEIFIKSINHQKEFYEWYNENRLMTTFSSGYNVLTTEELDTIFQIVTSGEADNAERIERRLKQYIPSIFLEKDFSLTFSKENVKSLLFDGILSLQNVDYYGDTLYQTLKIDRENKTLNFFNLSGIVYVGLVGDLHSDYTEQIKKELGLADYKIVTAYKSEDAAKELWVFDKISAFQILREAKKTQEKLAV